MYHTNATINFTNELLAFQNKHLNGAHFISDIQLPWLTQHYLIFYKAYSEASWYCEQFNYTLFCFKVGLLPSKKTCLLCVNESPLKMMKNAFYFIF